jgi:hypothetical protein
VIRGEQLPAMYDTNIDRLMHFHDTWRSPKNPLNIVVKP